MQYWQQENSMDLYQGSWLSEVNFCEGLIFLIFDGLGILELPCADSVHELEISR
jgi:hypothetical protein